MLVDVDLDARRATVEVQQRLGAMLQDRQYDDHIRR